MLDLLVVVVFSFEVGAALLPPRTRRLNYLEPGDRLFVFSAIL